MKKNTIVILGVTLSMIVVFGLTSGFIFAFTKKRKPHDIKSILFVGDSFSAGAPNFSYSYIIKNTLKSKLVDVVAMSGAKTDWMLQSLNKQLSLLHYDRVYIWGGINDVFAGIADSQIIANIQKMVDMIVAQGGEAFVIIGYNAKKFMTDTALLPTAYFTKTQMMQARDRYIVFQKELARKIKGAIIVDEFDLNPSPISDGTHPDGIQHKYIAQVLLKDYME